MGYGFGGGFGGANMQQIMRQAQKMQEEMERTRAELDATDFCSKVGGGMVEVVMKGNKTLQSIKINPQVVDPDDVEMLEDLIISGVNDCINQISRAEQEKLPRVPGM